MKQLGNLAIVCAQHPDVILHIHNGQVFVHVGIGPDRITLHTKWDNDAKIDHIIQKLNFGKYREQEVRGHAA